MTARQIIIPDATPSRDANGRALPAKLRFYLPDTTTPATVYTSELLTVAHSWPILSDSTGRFASIWADDALSFDVTYSDIASDTTIRSYEDVQPAEGAVLASGALAQSAADSAAASATAAAASEAGAEAAYQAAIDFIEPFGDLNTAVTQAQTSATAASGSATSASASATAAAASAQGAANVGRHALWILAEGMKSRNTNGAVFSATETTTNKVNYRGFDFDASTPQYLQVDLSLPKSWDRGMITFQPYWLHGSTTTNFRVSWGLQGVAAGNDEAIDTAFGTAQYSNDIGGTTGNLYIGPESSAITIGGSPTAGDLIWLQVLRKADDATNDTLAVNATLLGIMVYITTNQGNDA